MRNTDLTNNGAITTCPELVAKTQKKNYVIMFFTILENKILNVNLTDTCDDWKDVVPNQQTFEYLNSSTRRREICKLNDRKGTISSVDIVNLV